MSRAPAVLFALALAGAIALAAEPDVPKSATPAANRFEPLRPKLWSKDKAERDKAFDAYLAGGADGRKQLIEDLLELRAAAVAACREIYLSEETQKKLLTGYKKLADARKEALRVIFDTTIYPDADHGRVGQPIVDKAVNTVKGYYPLFRKAFDPVLTRFERVPRAHARILEADALLEKLEVKGIEFRPTIEKLMACDPELLKALLELREYTDFCERVVRYNRAIRTTASDPERRVVDLTNEYRMQLGVKPMALSEPLTQAARKHSQEMQRLGYFGHDSPTAATRSPGQRCQNEGYANWSGENCASGNMAPEGAFQGWYNSSGHHRNMLGQHSEFGVGVSGTLWSEDFGGRPNVDLDNPPRTLPKPATPPPPKDPPKKK